MRDRIHFITKLGLALVVGSAVYFAASRIPQLQDAELEGRLLAVSAFGTEAQQDRIVEELGRRTAIKNDVLDFYERGQALKALMAAHQRLAALDPEMAQRAIEHALEECNERKLAAANGE
jgi:hypothetical protein